MVLSVTNVCERYLFIFPSLHPIHLAPLTWSACFSILIYPITTYPHINKQTMPASPNPLLFPIVMWHHKSSHRNIDHHSCLIHVHGVSLTNICTQCWSKEDKGIEVPDQGLVLAWQETKASPPAHTEDSCVSFWPHLPYFWCLNCAKSTRDKPKAEL